MVISWDFMLWSQHRYIIWNYNCKVTCLNQLILFYAATIMNLFIVIKKCKWNLSLFYSCLHHASSLYIKLKHQLYTLSLCYSPIYAQSDEFQCVIYNIIWDFIFCLWIKHTVMACHFAYHWFMLDAQFLVVRNNLLKHSTVTCLLFLWVI